MKKSRGAPVSQGSMQNEEEQRGSCLKAACRMKKSRGAPVSQGSMQNEEEQRDSGISKGLTIMQNEGEQRDSGVSRQYAE